MASATLAQNGPPDQCDVVIGIDTHRDFHVAVALAPNGSRLSEYRIPTTCKGYEDLNYLGGAVRLQAGVRHGGHQFLRSRPLP